jgi:Predicted transcriptional regulator containing an HTH domain and an uncharacterized domain shared with the mammalian protein Schlafen
MHYLYENAPISRTELATLTGLNKTTVSSLINELLENQFVREIGIDQPTTAGRRSVLLNVNPFTRLHLKRRNRRGFYFSYLC